MKFFLSRRNGLLVGAPHVSYPVPKCGDVMCPVVVVEPFACPPQLDQLTGPVVFSILAETGDAPEEVIATGAVFLDDAWVLGEAPDGVPPGMFVFYLYSAEDGFFVVYGDGAFYELVVVSVFDSKGIALIKDVSMPIFGDYASYGTGDEGFPLLVEGETYCVVLNLTPTEGGE